MCECSGSNEPCSDLYDALMGSANFLDNKCDYVDLENLQFPVETSTILNNRLIVRQAQHDLWYLFKHAVLPGETVDGRVVPIRTMLIVGPAGTGKVISHILC